MKRVTLESPYAGNVAQNKAYAALATLVLAGRGWAAYASHLHFTSFLDDAVTFERTLGMDLGLELARGSEAAVFATDRGWSEGTLQALDRHRAEGRPCYALNLGPDLLGDQPPTQTLDRYRVFLGAHQRPDYLLFQFALGAVLTELSTEGALV